MTMTANSIVDIAGLNKWYGDFHVLRDINLDVAKGERIVICGPSGSGKSTLIRCINALEEFQEGQIVVDGIELGPICGGWTKSGAKSASYSRASICFRI
jgi:general L-amino acid transport system ATP-binding protein